MKVTLGSNDMGLSAHLQASKAGTTRFFTSNTHSSVVLQVSERLGRSQPPAGELPFQGESFLQRLICLVVSLQPRSPSGWEGKHRMGSPPWSRRTSSPLLIKHCSQIGAWLLFSVIEGDASLTWPKKGGRGGEPSACELCLTALKGICQAKQPFSVNVLLFLSFLLPLAWSVKKSQFHYLAVGCAEVQARPLTSALGSSPIAPPC